MLGHLSLMEKKMGYRVVVVGATGNVGREMLQIMADRRFPADEVVALASERHDIAGVGVATDVGAAEQVDPVLQSSRLHAGLELTSQYRRMV